MDHHLLAFRAVEVADRGHQRAAIAGPVAHPPVVDVPGVEAERAVVAVATAGEMTVTDLFLIRTYAEEVYTQFALGDTPDEAAWQLLPTCLAAAWVIAAGLYLAARLIPADRLVAQRAATVFRLGRWRAAVSAAVFGMVGLLVATAAGSLAVQAGRVVTREGDSFARGWSLLACLGMVLGSPLRFAREIGWTVLIAALAATAAAGPPRRLNRSSWQQRALLRSVRQFSCKYFVRGGHG